MCRNVLRYSRCAKSAVAAFAPFDCTEALAARIAPLAGMADLLGDGVAKHANGFFSLFNAAEVL
jgi:hypothetical protein